MFYHVGRFAEELKIRRKLGPYNTLQTAAVKGSVASLLQLSKRLPFDFLLRNCKFHFMTDKFHFMTEPTYAYDSFAAVSSLPE